MSAKLQPIERPRPHTSLRDAQPQPVRAGAAYQLIIDSLSLSESDAKRVEKVYELSPETQHALGYRSCPEPLTLRTPQLSGRDLSFDEIAALKQKAHQPLDQLSDDEFLDWFTYSKETLADLERDAFEKVRYRVDKIPIHQELIEREIVSRLGQLEDVAGIYFDDRLRVKLPERGLLVPVRRGGLIRAIVCYPKIGQDFIYLITSNNLPGGAKASPSIHVVNPKHAQESGVIILCERPIQADVMAQGESLTVASHNGLLPFAVVGQLRETFPGLHSVLINSESVDWSLVRKLRESGLTVEVTDYE
jgi:hypothetical protein